MTLRTYQPEVMEAIEKLADRKAEEAAIAEGRHDLHLVEVNKHHAHWAVHRASAKARLEVRRNFGLISEEDFQTRINELYEPAPYSNSTVTA